MSNTSPEKKCICNDLPHIPHQHADGRIVKEFIKKTDTSPTPEQIRWKKDMGELIEKCIGIRGEKAYDVSYAAPREAYQKAIESFFIQTLQHLHDEIMEKKKWHGLYRGKQKRIITVDIEDLQAIFTRYGVGNNNK